MLAAQRRSAWARHEADSPLTLLGWRSEKRPAVSGRGVHRGDTLLSYSTIRFGIDGCVKLFVAGRAAVPAFIGEPVRFTRPIPKRDTDGLGAREMLRQPTTRCHQTLSLGRGIALLELRQAQPFGGRHGGADDLHDPLFRYMIEVARLRRLPRVGQIQPERRNQRIDRMRRLVRSHAIDARRDVLREHQHQAFVALFDQPRQQRAGIVRDQPAPSAALRRVQR
ncbi:hypothetical protein DFQ28_001620, partial [Apophysomyces sp. BC1034]